MFIAMWDNPELCRFTDSVPSKMLAGLGKFLRRSADREPVVVASFALGIIGISLPLVAVPIRRNLGYPTDQYDGPTNPGLTRQPSA